MTQYFKKLNKVPLGPFTLEALQNQYNQGILDEDNLISTDRKTWFKAIEIVPQIFNSGQQIVAPLPPVNGNNPVLPGTPPPTPPTPITNPDELVLEPPTNGPGINLPGPYIPNNPYNPSNPYNPNVTSPGQSYTSDPEIEKVICNSYIYTLLLGIVFILAELWYIKFLYDLYGSFKADQKILEANLDVPLGHNLKMLKFVAMTVLGESMFVIVQFGRYFFSIISYRENPTQAHLKKLLLRINEVWLAILINIAITTILYFTVKSQLGG